MLKRVTLKNFVNFKSSQTLTFGNCRENGGVFMFVGPNACGKSTVFEAIRRCSEVRNNVSISSRKRDDYSLAMCLYENLKNDTMASYYMVWEDKKGQSTGTNDGSTESGSKDAASFVAIKVLITRVKNESDYDHSLVWSKWSKGDEMVSPWKPYEDQSLDTPVKDKLLMFATTEKTNDDTQCNEIAAILKKIHTQALTKIDKKEHADFDDKFQRFTDIKFLFGHRGISPIQSSKQVHNVNENLYRKGTDNAYIIRQFLETAGTSECDSDVYYTNMEEEVFRLITSESYEFTLDDKQIFGRPKNAPLSEDAPLLKMSEGIVEAKCISILLSKKSTRTLILEEPGRGMNKNYVDSMVNRVFLDDRFTDKKTIILSTHNRDFLTPKTLCRTFFFKRNVDDGSKIHQLTEAHKRNTCVFITNLNVSNIFFSKRTLFVEGESDRLFVTMIKEILLQGASTPLVKKICDGDEEAQNKFKDFLATLNIISQGAAKEMNKAELICKDLGITSRMYLFDGDQEEDCNKLLEPYKRDDRPSIFLWKCECQTADEGPKHPKDRKHKKGDLEDVLLNLARKHDKKFHPAKEESCTLKGCNGMKTDQIFQNMSKALIQPVLSQDAIESGLRLVVEATVDLYPETEIARFLKFLKDNSQG